MTIRNRADAEQFYYNYAGRPLCEHCRAPVYAAVREGTPAVHPQCALAAAEKLAIAARATERAAEIEAERKLFASLPALKKGYKRCRNKACLQPIPARAGKCPSCRAVYVKPPKKTRAQRREESQDEAG